MDMLGTIVKLREELIKSGKWHRKLGFYLENYLRDGSEESREYYLQALSNLLA